MLIKQRLWIAAIRNVVQNTSGKMKMHPTDYMAFGCRYEDQAWA